MVKNGASSRKLSLFRLYLKKKRKPYLLCRNRMITVLMQSITSIFAKLSEQLKNSFSIFTTRYKQKMSVQQSRSYTVSDGGTNHKIKNWHFISKDSLLMPLNSAKLYKVIIYQYLSAISVPSTMILPRNSRALNSSKRH